MGDSFIIIFNAGIMIPSETSSQGRRKFFAAFGLSALALAVAAVHPFSMLTGKVRGMKRSSSTAVPIVPNPMAVQRAQRGAAHHG
jgi:hypothetical protein